MAPSLYDEYEAYVDKYRAEYGPKAVVLYRCGQFYELYSIDDGKVDLKTLSELLNIQVSRRNKSIPEVNRSNMLMAGFPMFALRKFVATLVANNYVVVIVDQVSEPPKPKRAVTEVISPGTVIDNVDAYESNNLMTIYVEEVADWATSKPLLCVGIAFMDITTGAPQAMEIAPRSTDLFYSLDEAYRVVVGCNPKEVVVFGSCKAVGFNDIVAHMELGSRMVHNKLNLYDKELNAVAYQNLVLERVYKERGMLSGLEYVGLEAMPYAATALVCLLRFACQHNEDVLRHITRPTLMTEGNRLQLHFNSARQLNIITGNGAEQGGLLHILNHCTTAIGRRAFKEALLNPILDPAQLQKKYDVIEWLMHGGRADAAARCLSGVYDLSRLLRKAYIGRFHPCDIVQVDSTLRAIMSLQSSVPGLVELFGWGKEEIGALMRIVEEYGRVIDIDLASKCTLDNLDGSFFREGYDSNIDALQAEVDANMAVLDGVVASLNAGGRDGFFKKEDNERDGHYLLVTAKRYRDACAGPLLNWSFKHDATGYEFKIADMHAKPVSHSSSSLKVTHKAFEKIGNTILAAKTKLAAALVRVFKTFVIGLAERHAEAFDKAVVLVGEVDIAVNNALNAEKFKHFRPVIRDAHGGKSYVCAKEVRHPIVERINDGVEYVPNDIELGVPGVRDGMLLFGLNCSGKTTLSKAVALAVIMAQAGMFVPARMAYWPYRSVFTRIPSGDDIFKSMSTFAVEMSELRNILKRCDANSLVVGDEISHGTEVTSGVAIVGAAICQLASRRASFVFATHLHNIVQIPEVKALDNVTLHHLSVAYDEAAQKLVYDRHLKDGPGSSIYGLEVCKALDLPADFLGLANAIRQRQLGVDPNIIGTRRSNYNKDVYMDRCELCGAATDEIHHIRPQHMDDGTGYIRGTATATNARHNLVNLCAQCHDQVHAGAIEIQGFKQTSAGRELVWNKTEHDGDKGAAVNADILRLKKQGHSVAAIIKAVKQTHNVELTRYKVGKVLAGALAAA